MVDANYIRDCASMHFSLWNENLSPHKTQTPISMWNFYTKMGDFDIMSMTQNSNSIKFDMDFFIGILFFNLRCKGNNKSSTGM